MKLNRAITGDIFWSLVAILIIAVGVVGFRVMGALQKPIEALPVERASSVVETQLLQVHSEPIPVRGTGFVSPARQVAVAALGGGRITELHSALFNLGHVKKGETLVQLDDRAAVSDLSRTTSEIASTQARLSLNATQLERSRSLRRRGVISQDELDQLEAQQTELEATLASVESARVSAQINLEYMRVLAPFNARVMSRQAEVGDVVAAGFAIAELYTDHDLEVTVPLTEKEALLIPGLLSMNHSASEKMATPAQAEVVVEFGGEIYKWSAAVSRVAGALDRQSRLLDVTVSLAVPSEGFNPVALVNSYATVTIDGRKESSVLIVPASALRAGDTVWLASDGVLEIRDVMVLHLDSGNAYVKMESTFSENAQLITSTLDVPVDGMAVQSSSVHLGALTLNP